MLKKVTSDVWICDSNRIFIVAKISVEGQKNPPYKFGN